jgi:hypothetical protein
MDLNEKYPTMPEDRRVVGEDTRRIEKVALYAFLFDLFHVVSTDNLEEALRSVLS